MEDNARGEVTKIDGIKKRAARLEQAALNKRYEQMYERVQNKNSFVMRHRNARSVAQTAFEKNTNESISDYHNRLQEIKRIRDTKTNREKMRSAQHFKYLNGPRDTLPAYESDNEVLVLEASATKDQLNITV